MQSIQDLYKKLLKIPRQTHTVPAQNKLSELPPEIVMEILDRLDYLDLLRLFYSIKILPCIHSKLYKHRVY